MVVTVASHAPPGPSHTPPAGGVSVGARGYTQVMPFWTRVIGDGDPGKLFHMQTNLRFGCVILRHYLDRERGDLFLALGRYNGSRGRAPYPNAVQGAQRNWVFSG